MALVIWVFSDPIIVLFAGSDPEMRELGRLCIRLQCLALPIHAWVAMVNMLCVGLGNAGGALLLSTARQGSCFIPILYPLAFFFGANGVVSVQAIADILTLIPAIPIAIAMTKKVKKAKAALGGGQLTADS
jgi:Na+-driven multidrug efflux pump